MGSSGDAVRPGMAPPLLQLAARYFAAICGFGSTRCAAR